MVTFTPASPAFGGTVKFTATVSPGTTAVTPTGTVNFLDGATALASGKTLAAGKATFSINTLNAGNHTITAVYSGDSNFQGSTSPNKVVTVTGAKTTTTLTQLGTVTTAAAAATGATTITIALWEETCRRAGRLRSVALRRP